MDKYRDSVYAANPDLNWHDMETVEADVVWYHGFWALVVDCEHCGKTHRHNGGKPYGRRPTQPIQCFRPCAERTLYTVVPKPEPPPSGKPLYTREDWERRWYPVGEANPRAKLTEAHVREIRARYEAGEVTQTALAQEYGVDPSTVNQIVNRRLWAHL